MEEMDAKEIEPVKRWIARKSRTERLNFVGAGKVPQATMKLLDDESSVEEQSI